MILTVVSLHQSGLGQTPKVYYRPPPCDVLYKDTTVFEIIVIQFSTFYHLPLV